MTRLLRVELTRLRWRRAVLLLLAFCYWDGRGRYRQIVREAERAKRK